MASPVQTSTTSEVEGAFCRVSIGETTACTHTSLIESFMLSSSIPACIAQLISPPPGDNLTWAPFYCCSLRHTDHSPWQMRGVENPAPLHSLRSIKLSTPPPWAGRGTPPVSTQPWTPSHAPLYLDQDRYTKGVGTQCVHAVIHVWGTLQGQCVGMSMLVGVWVLLCKSSGGLVLVVELSLASSYAPGRAGALAATAALQAKPHHTGMSPTCGMMIGFAEA